MKRREQFALAAVAGMMGFYACSADVPARGSATDSATTGPTSTGQGGDDIVTGPVTGSSSGLGGYCEPVLLQLYFPTGNICEPDLPALRMGSFYDVHTLDVKYTPGDNSGPQGLVMVHSSSLCMPSAFYTEPPNHIVLCPQACAVVEADVNPTLSAQLSCPFY